MKKSMVCLLLLTALLTVGCTQNQRARKFGGTMTVNLPKNTKLVNATWKEGNDLWYLTRTMKEGEQPERLEFIEDSSVGMFNGKVVFVESR